MLTESELNGRFPGYQVPKAYRALYQPDGGFLVPEKATVAFVEAAHQLGAVIHAREKVLNWESIQDGVRVKTNRGQYEADSLIFTAGAWNSALLLELDGLAVPERQVLA